jgi:peptidyl-prolyl cis-trans isomerase SurA
MRKLVIACCSIFCMANISRAQVLFTYGDHTVTKQEFLKNYQKNDLGSKPDLSEKALRNYLDLYALFKMRVKEAEILQIDTIPSVRYELSNYKKQLAKNYLTDKQMADKLSKEAYDRMKEERRVAHILFMAPATMNPDDTLKLYKRMDSLYKVVSADKNAFSKIAAAYSEDVGTKDNGGELGYMTALQTPYVFENVVYSTQPGTISRPFRSPLGFHLVYVKDKRPARGEVEVAQILITTPPSKGKEGKEEAKKRAKEVLSAYKKGVPFDTLVHKYSEDKFTISENGKMKKFGVGTMTPTFEDAAFALKNPGDVSEPIETEYGYHIIRLIKKYPLKPYDSLKKELDIKIASDTRSKIAKDMYVEKIKQQNGFKEFPENLKPIENLIKAIPDTGEKANVFDISHFAGLNNPLFTLGNTTHTQQDFVNYIELMSRGKIPANRPNFTEEVYNLYLTRVINEFQEDLLLKENEEYRNLMSEYRDGIVLFELMDQQIWGKASKDSAGLQQFYENNKSKYLWEPGFSGAIYRFKDKSSLEKGLSILQKNINASHDDLVAELNTQERPDNVTIQTGRYEFSKFTEYGKDELKEGALTTAKPQKDGSYLVVRVEKVFNTTTQKSLEDARGYVIAEYQDYLEKAWNQALKDKYPVKVDEKVFNSMVKK